MLMVMKNHLDSRPQRGFTFIEGLLIVILVGIVGFASWYIYDSNNKANNIYDNVVSTGVTDSFEKKAVNEPTQQAEPSSPISDSLKENSADAIKSGNTAALESYMTNSVTVVIAASEKDGAESKAAAVKDLDYLKSATAPWDFALTPEVLKGYSNGYYGKYFGNSTIVGKSADGKIVSFGVNKDGKIDTVFMAASVDSVTN